MPKTGKWTWLGVHRWLGLVVGLFMLFQGVTGAIAQQRYPLLAWSVPDVYAAGSVAETPLRPGEILKLVSESDPAFRTAHVMYPAEASPGTAVIVMGGRKPTGMDMSRTITVDQYAGEIITEQPSSASTWIGLATGLHKWSTTGNVGRTVATVFAILTIAFLVSAFANWWRTYSYANQFKGLRRWHRKAGIVVAILFSFTAVTGLALNLTVWIEKSSGNSVVTANMSAAMSGGAPKTVAVDIETAYDRALDAIGQQHLAAFSEAGPHAAKHWFAFLDSRLKRSDVLVDAQSGELSVHPAGVISGGEGMRSWLFPIHSGYLFGGAGGLIMTLMGLSMIFWVVSGFLLWQRKHG